MLCGKKLEESNSESNTLLVSNGDEQLFVADFSFLVVPRNATEKKNEKTE